MIKEIRKSSNNPGPDRYTLGDSHPCIATSPNRRRYWIVLSAKRGIVNRMLESSSRQPAEPASSREEWACRIHDFREYISGLSEPDDGVSLISTDLARTALKTWWLLFGCCEGDLPVPDVGPGHDGDLILIWKRNDHYLSVEIAPGVPARAFYRNHRTGAIWGWDFDPCAREAPRPIVEKLGFFLVND